MAVRFKYNSQKEIDWMPFLNQALYSNYIRMEFSVGTQWTASLHTGTLPTTAELIGTQMRLRNSGQVSQKDIQQLQ